MDRLLERIAALEGAHRLMERRLRRWRGLACLLLLASVSGGLLLSGGMGAAAGQARPAASGSGTLTARVAALEATVAYLKAAVQNRKRAPVASPDSVKKACGAEAAARQQALQELRDQLETEIAARQEADAGAAKTATAAAEHQAALQAEMAPVVEKLAHFSIENVDGCYSVVLTGANLHLRSGSGATNGNPARPFSMETITSNGLGNLIIGYNESRALAGADRDLRSGSHNLILGQGQNFTSVGGLIAGQINSISGPGASVTGGQWNSASGPCASISGGTRSAATGPCASVGGGDMNNAAGRAAAVGGGRLNTASGEAAVVNGGANRGATVPNSWAAGGLFQPN
jgi:hypothetical protein